MKSSNNMFTKNIYNCICFDYVILMSDAGNKRFEFKKIINNLTMCTSCKQYEI